MSIACCDNMWTDFISSVQSRFSDEVLSNRYRLLNHFNAKFSSALKFNALPQKKTYKNVNLLVENIQEKILVRTSPT